MKPSEFGIYAALLYALTMFMGVWVDRLWLAKIRPLLKRQPTFTFKELNERLIK